MKSLMKGRIMATPNSHNEAQALGNQVDTSVLVLEEDERPNGKGSGVCFYCQEKIGTPHKWECVIPQKWVLVRMTADIPMEMPRSWTKDDIEFKLNESSWCANNIVDDLQTLVDNGLDLCNITEFEYIRDGKVIEADTEVTTAASPDPETNTKAEKNA
jgi:hypothetical protein